MQLHPQEKFVITRQLQDPNDTDTKYIRAVVRNAKTDELLKTVSLSHKGNNRFSAEYEVPADISGLGFWISIVTTVFTDSGFTTLNPNYGEEMTTYLVQIRPSNLSFGGSGGPDVDYKKIKKIIDTCLDERVQTIIEAIPGPVKPLKIDYEKILQPIEILAKSVNDSLNKLIDKQPVDLMPLFREIYALKQDIEGLPDRMDKVELTPLKNAILELSTAIEKDNEDRLVSDNNSKEEIMSLLNDLSEKISEAKDNGFTLKLDTKKDIEEDKTESESNPLQDKVKSLLQS